MGSCLVRSQFVWREASAPVMSPVWSLRSCCVCIVAGHTLWTVATVKLHVLSACDYPALQGRRQAFESSRSE
ncbi:hypothetical protein Y1Q_0014283 [Alligator mississippiensis]|uniref:Uncharacterized protein n=1 Tax=Alligator mississippiensis TaxID=8496 RepID=A0A151MKU3_ALLMI|nr:hypothetical protein Y1Q_0014283 [Alligator mississippiensis]